MKMVRPTKLIGIAGAALLATGAVRAQDAAASERWRSLPAQLQQSLLDRWRGMSEQQQEEFRAGASQRRLHWASLSGEARDRYREQFEQAPTANGLYEQRRDAGQRPERER